MKNLDIKKVSLPSLYQSYILRANAQPRECGLFLCPNDSYIYARYKDGVVPPFVRCNGVRVRSNCVIGNGKGNAVFSLLPSSKYQIQMKAINQSPDVLKVLDFDGNNVTFKIHEGTLQLNATQMAAPFGKEPKDFLRTQQIKDYITELEQSANMPTEQIYIVKNGGSERGTWFCELLAIRFAQWLSAKFSIWVDMKIRELMRGVPRTGLQELAFDMGKFEIASSMTVHFNVHEKGVVAIPSGIAGPEKCIEAIKAFSRMFYIQTGKVVNLTMEG